MTCFDEGWSLVNEWFNEPGVDRHGQPRRRPEKDGGYRR
jgi:hypothetical protein